MKNGGKKEYLKMLESNKAYQNALKMFKTDEERDKARALAEEVFLKIFEGFQSTHSIAVKQPDKFTEVVKDYINKNNDGK